MKLGWRVAIVVLAVGTGLYLSRKPWEVYREQKAKSDAAAKEMTQAEKDRVRLVEQKARAGSSYGREEAVRNWGWHKANETPADN